MNIDAATIKTRLLALKDEFEALSASASTNRKPIALDQQSVGRLSRMDSLQVQAMDLAQEQNRRRQIVRIDAALDRVESGDYGYCVTCDEEIGQKRLEFDPAVPLCINCAK
ncbi:MAG: TraR/DksA family transcriptional regulator [Hellea sp.]|nr:TraR/DksA family transcriptional regulator [Hellea sp.]